MKQYICSVLLVVLPGIILHAQDKETSGQIPKKVMECLKTRFPKIDIDKWSKEKEGGIVVYDVEFKQDGEKYEADVTEDGAIDNWEQAIDARELPPAVKKAVDTKYPRSRLKEIMRTTQVKNGKDVLEGYEIVLTTSGKKNVEVTVAPDGRIVEDSTDKK